MTYEKDEELAKLREQRGFSYEDEVMNLNQLIYCTLMYNMLFNDLANYSQDNRLKRVFA